MNGPVKIPRMGSRPRLRRYVFVISSLVDFACLTLVLVLLLVIECGKRGQALRGRESKQEPTAIHGVTLTKS